MPRQARLTLPGYVYHVTQRGNHQINVFEEDKDRVIYLKYILKYSQEFALKIYAYCLMDNHVHFIVLPLNKSSMARTFQISHQRYAYYFQKKTRRTGHLWQGRFFSCLIQEKHLREGIRYVENNPVRAKMKKLPWEYIWSSARAHIGKRYKIIKVENIKEILDVPSWKDFLMQQERQKFLKLIRMSTFKGRYVGTKEFIKNLEAVFNIRILHRKRGRPKMVIK